MTLMAVPWMLSTALAFEPPAPELTAAVPQVETTADSSLERVRPLTHPSLQASFASPAPRGWRAPLRLPRAQQANPDGPPAAGKQQRRSRNLLLGALAAEAAAGALLGGAMAVRDSYEATDSPTQGMYRANRVMGHAGYASAIAGGALFLGSISMWEW